VVSIIHNAAVTGGLVADNTLRTHKARPAAFSIRHVNNRWYITTRLRGACEMKQGRGCVLTEEIDTNSNWQWELDPVREQTSKQISQTLTVQRLRERREEDTEDMMSRKKDNKGGIYLKNTLLLEVIFQYQILLAWEILWALWQTAGVLSSLVTEQERGPQCHTGLLSGHTGVI